jgi:hypothetical protein
MAYPGNVQKEITELAEMGKYHLLLLRFCDFCDICDSLRRRVTFQRIVTGIEASDIVLGLMTAVFFFRFSCQSNEISQKLLSVCENDNFLLLVFHKKMLFL